MPRRKVDARAISLPGKRLSCRVDRGGARSGEVDRRGGMADARVVDTVADAIRCWLEVQQERSRTPKPGAGHDDARMLHPDSYQKLVRRSAHMARSALGRMSLEALASVTWRDRIAEQQAPFFEYRDERLATGTAPLSVEQELFYFFTVLRFAARQCWWTGRLPPVADVVAGLHVRQKERCTPTDRDVELVLEALAGWKRLFVLIAYGTGARRVEIAKLRWRDVDWTRNTLLFRGKGGRDRTVLVEPALMDSLQWWRAKGRRRVHNGGSKVARIATGADDLVLGPTVATVKAEISRSIAGACDELGLRRWTPHGLRRLRVAWLKAAGVPATDAANMMGHSQEVMAMVYAETTLEDQAIALDRIRTAREERAARRARLDDGSA